MALATPALALLIRDIPPAAIHLYLLLGVLLFAWLLLIHLPPATVRLPKELAVGIFFPAAVFIPTVARAQWLRPVLLPEAILFAAVCGLNCLYIFAWEHPAAGRLASANDAHWTTLWAGRHLHTLTFATVAASLVVAAFAFQFALPFAYLASTLRLTALPAFACAGSVLLLHQLSRSRARLSPTHLRAAADLCLLTPLALLPVLR